MLRKLMTTAVAAALLAGAAIATPALARGGGHLGGGAHIGGATHFGSVGLSRGIRGFGNGLAGDHGGPHGRFVHGYGRGRIGFDGYQSCYPYVGVWPYCQY